MATNILMPALSPTMTEGTLARWLKKEGDQISAGDVIAEIETDKATMEVEAVDEGVLGKILIGDGTENVAVNAPIGILVEQGEEVPSEPPPSPAPPKPAGEQEAPKAEAPKSAPPKAAPARAEAPKPETTKGDLPPLDPAKPGELYDSKGERIFVSPLARRMAKQAGLDLASLKGSGPNGRIVRTDVEAAMAKGAPAAAPEAKPAAPPAAAAPAAADITAPHEKLPLSNMRKVIARRLLQSKQTVPHFYLSMDIELDSLLKLRGELNAQAPKEGAGAFKLSVNDLLIKASAVALRRVPEANSTYTEEAIIRYTDVDISVAVAIAEGLITPIIRKADQKGLSAISNEMKDLASRAKAGKLKPEEFQGGSFSISNLGMYGISSFSAIINPPQGAILAIGAGEKRPVVRDDKIVTRTMMTVTLSSDHRVVDGAVGAEFLAAFKSIVEQPLSLML